MLLKCERIFELIHLEVRSFETDLFFQVLILSLSAGFSHKSNPSSIDLNVVRLCFQVFLEGDRGKFTRPLAPVVSETIFDKKAMSDLTICKLSDCTSPANGGREIILLCEKVSAYFLSPL